MGWGVRRECMGPFSQCESSQLGGLIKDGGLVEEGCLDIEGASTAQGGDRPGKFLVSGRDASVFSTCFRKEMGADLGYGRTRKKSVSLSFSHLVA